MYCQDTLLVVNYDGSKEMRGGSMNLREWIDRERSARDWSWRELGRRIGKTRSPFDNLKKNADAIPELDTLRRLSEVFETPLWRVVDIASGGASGVAGSISPDADRASALVRSMPDMADLVLKAMDLPKEDRRGVLAYLEVVDRRRSEAAARLAEEDDDQSPEPDPEDS